MDIDSTCVRLSRENAQAWPRATAKGFERRMRGARKGEPAASIRRLPVVGHLVGDGGRVGVGEHARVVARARDADTEGI